jgi:phosphoribosylanthranilate isomerase
MWVVPIVAPKIKFCGITNPDDAAAAVEFGAWAIGVILWSRSKRRCQPAVAAEIADEFRRRVEVVGVFINPSLDEVTQAAEAIGLTMIQLHGDEGPVFCAELARRTGVKVIKAVRVRGRSDIQALRPFHTDFHLLDSHVPGERGGTGATFEWELARSHRGPIPVILSGGLTPENVAQAITVAEPYAVDVASGVELSPGEKDGDKLEAFVAAVHSTVPVHVPVPEPVPVHVPEPVVDYEPMPAPVADYEPMPEPVADPDPEHVSP